MAEGSRLVALHNDFARGADDSPHDLASFWSVRAGAAAMREVECKVAAQRLENERLRAEVAALEARESQAVADVKRCAEHYEEACWQALATKLALTKARVQIDARRAWARALALAGDEADRCAAADAAFRAAEDQLQRLSLQLSDKKEQRARLLALHAAAGNEERRLRALLESCTRHIKDMRNAIGLFQSPQEPDSQGPHPTFENIDMPAPSADEDDDDQDSELDVARLAADDGFDAADIFSSLPCRKLDEFLRENLCAQGNLPSALLARRAWLQVAPDMAKSFWPLIPSTPASTQSSNSRSGAYALGSGPRPS